MEKQGSAGRLIQARRARHTNKRNHYANVSFLSVRVPYVLFNRRIAIRVHRSPGLKLIFTLWLFHHIPVYG